MNVTSHAALVTFLWHFTSSGVKIDFVFSDVFRISQRGRPRGDLVPISLPCYHIAGQRKT